MRTFPHIPIHSCGPLCIYDAPKKHLWTCLPTSTCQQVIHTYGNMGNVYTYGVLGQFKSFVYTAIILGLSSFEVKKENIHGENALHFKVQVKSV